MAVRVSSSLGILVAALEAVDNGFLGAVSINPGACARI
jgi:hypothetical protein